MSTRIERSMKMSSAYNRKVCLGCKAPMFYKVPVSQYEGTGVRKIPGSVYVRFTVRVNSKQADEAIKDGHFCAPCVAEGKAAVFFDQCLELAAEHTHTREEQKQYTTNLLPLRKKASAPPMPEAVINWPPTPEAVINWIKEVFQK